MYVIVRSSRKYPANTFLTKSAIGTAPGGVAYGIFSLKGVMQGRVKIHRKIENRERYTDIPTKVLFFHFLIKANHE